jgi:hypothetical protein
MSTNFTVLLTITKAPPVFIFGGADIADCAGLDATVALASAVVTDIGRPLSHSGNERAIA